MQTEAQNRGLRRKRLWGAFFAASAIVAITLVFWPKEQPAPSAASEPSLPQPYAAIAKGRVDVAGGLIRLAASRDGIVKAVFVEEGEIVKKGQILATLVDDAVRLAEKVAQHELSQAEAAIPLLQVRLRAAERQVKRLEALLPGAAVARVEYDQAQDQVALIKAELTVATTAISTYRSRLRLAAHEMERSAVRAPMDGEIVRRTARPGDGVSSLNVTPLFLFAPNVPRIVRAELEERFVGQVRAGMAAEIVFEADESRILPATVMRVGRVFGLQQPVGDDPTQRQDLRVVDVTLRPALADLLIGQRVLVKFKRAAIHP